MRSAVQPRPSRATSPLKAATAQGVAAPAAMETPPRAPAQPPLAAQRLSDQLAERLAAQLSEGRFAPGERLPTEPQLAAEHGVSRTVVREAVNQLKSRGLLKSRQGSGVYVVGAGDRRPLTFDPTVLGSMDAVVQVVEVRRALEGEIAALAATRGGKSHVAALRQALQRIEDAVAAGGDGVAEDLAFHRAIAQATGNPQFSQLLGFLEQYLREAMRITRGNEARHRDFADAVRAEHRALVDAIEAGDPASARRAAVKHMQQASKRLVTAGVVAPATPGVESPPTRSTRGGRTGRDVKGNAR